MLICEAILHNLQGQFTCIFNNIHDVNIYQMKYAVL